MSEINILKRIYGDENRVSVELSNDIKPIGINTIEKNIDEYRVYCDERDSCSKYRAIFTIFPVCCNILFNANTEIVYNEGSPECISVRNNPTNNEKIDFVDGINDYCAYKGVNPLDISRLDMIRDTAFSGKYAGGLTYHCGTDIFNNHYFRSDDFFVVNRITSKTLNKNVFNTLFDFSRNEDGEEVTEKMPDIVQNDEIIKKEINTHLYQNDTVKSFQRSINDNLIERDGWIGFDNKVTMDIPNYEYNGEEVSINRCMNDVSGGSQIDMYPDRTLFSFVPKLNKFRNRIERNWDYCLTYPYRKEFISLVTHNGVNGLECFVEQNLNGSIFDVPTANSDGNVKLRSVMRNNLKRGDFITATVIDTSTSMNYSVGIPFMVENTEESGENLHYFSIKSQFLSSLFSNILGDIVKQDDSFVYTNRILDDEGNLLRRFKIIVRKSVGGIDCEYYLRIFKRIPNYRGMKYSDTDDYGSPNENDFSSNLNKLAFSKTIYNDDNFQIVFDDDIDIEGLKNNIGMKPDKIYLTIVKRNAGHEEWYVGHDYGNENVEYSHCFGKVTSGFDFSHHDSKYNIHKLHNIEGYNVNSPYPLEDDITIHPDNSEFAGDIVEFDPLRLEEKTLEPVYHRFNTVQREIISNDFGRIFVDDIVSDDYDPDGFSVNTGLFNGSSSMNICPEGYYYKPHYEIKINEFRENVNEGSHTKIIFVPESLSSVEDNVYSGLTSVPYYISKGEFLYAYNRKNGENSRCEVIGVSGKLFNEITFLLNVNSGYSVYDYVFFKPDLSMPEFSYELNDGTGRYLWKEQIPYDELDRNSDLYKMIFTNGAKYIYKNINFYLKRQDPEGKYGLNRIGTIDWYTGASECTIKDVSVAEYEEEGVNKLC